MAGFEESIRRLKERDISLWLAVHPAQNHTMEKAARLKDGKATQPVHRSARLAGISNDQEYLAGTAPRDANSRFEITSASRLADGSFTGAFAAVAGKSYTVKFSDDLVTWSKLLDYTAPATSATTFADPAPGVTRRFYRIVTPAVP